MTRFDTVAMVDWSGGGDTGARPRKDAIWAAVQREAIAEPPVYLRNRALAGAWLSRLVEAELAKGRRLLLGFDFPFGYPAGFAAAVGGARDPLVLWDWLADAFAELPEGAGRFDLAAQLNRLFPGVGPFWFNGLARDIPDLPRKGRQRTAFGLAERRHVECRAKGSFSCWQMGGAGAVGSQAMTGMAALAQLRRRHRGQIAVWPFEPLDRPVALVEIWPSLLAEEVRVAMAATGETIRDRAQVMLLAGAVFRAQGEGALAAMFCAGTGMPDLAEEGWILGVGAEDTLRRAAVAAPRPGPASRASRSQGCASPRR